MNFKHRVHCVTFESHCSISVSATATIYEKANSCNYPMVWKKNTGCTSFIA